MLKYDVTPSSFGHSNNRLSLRSSFFLSTRYAQLLADGEEDDADLLEKVCKLRKMASLLHMIDDPCVLLYCATLP